MHYEISNIGKLERMAWILKFILIICVIFSVDFSLKAQTKNTDINSSNQEIDSFKLSIQSRYPDLLLYEISGCMHKCLNDSGKIITKKLVDDVLEIEVLHWLNCANYNSYGGYAVDNDKLHLFVTEKPKPAEYRIDKNTGEKFEVVDLVLCDCPFKIKYRIKGITQMPLVFTVNGKPINNYLGIE